MCEEEDEEEEANCHYRQLGWLLLQNDLQKCCINWAGLFITATCVCARLAVSDRPNEVLTAVTVFFCIAALCHVNVPTFWSNILLPSTGFYRDSNAGSSSP
jgi:hypothetical protein